MAIRHVLVGLRHVLVGPGPEPEVAPVPTAESEGGPVPRGCRLLGLQAVECEVEELAAAHRRPRAQSIRHLGQRREWIEVPDPELLQDGIRKSAVVGPEVSEHGGCAPGQPPSGLERPDELEYAPDGLPVVDALEGGQDGQVARTRAGVVRGHQPEGHALQIHLDTLHLGT